MCKKKKAAVIILLVLLIPFACALWIIVQNKCCSSSYDQLNDTDQRMLAEYNQLYEAMQSNELWADFDLLNKPILALSRDSWNTYLINAKDQPTHLLTKKIVMPDDFKIQSVYRITPITPQVVKIRLDVGSSFNTIGTTYTLFANDVYYLKYTAAESFDKPYSGSHFAPFLVHESFHYYMQNDWKIFKIPQSSLNDDGIALLKDEYRVIDHIVAELNSKKSREQLLLFAKQYVDIVAKRLENNQEYVLSELSHETAEGTAQYLTIKASQMVGYDYGVMYFDNITNVPFLDIFQQIDAGNFSVQYLYDKMPYQTGAQLCLLFDELDIPNWQEKLNAQTLEYPINLYDILKEYVDDTLSEE